MYRTKYITINTSNFLNLCVCVLPTSRSILIVPNLRYIYLLRKGRHPSLYPAFPLEVFQVASSVNT